MKSGMLASAAGKLKGGRCRLSGRYPKAAVTQFGAADQDRCGTRIAKVFRQGFECETLPVAVLKVLDQFLGHVKLLASHQTRLRDNLMDDGLNVGR